MSVGLQLPSRAETAVFTVKEPRVSKTGQDISGEKNTKSMCKETTVTGTVAKFKSGTVFLIVVGTGLKLFDQPSYSITLCTIVLFISSLLSAVISALSKGVNDLKGRVLFWCWVSFRDIRSVF